MKILITNDDGIASKGLSALFAPLQKNGHEIIVVAPSYENSAASHAITVHDPIFVSEYEEFAESGIKAWSVTGRPADCVKIALEVFLKDSLPDFVVSGINRGPNMGLDTVYSGTVSAALEASMHSIPALAVSLDSRSRKADYTVAAEYAAKIVEEYHRFSLPKTSMINLNVPAVDSALIKGIKVVKLGNVAYDNAFAPRKDLQGRTYYWLGGELVENPGHDPELDVDAVGDNWVTITPLRYDLTDYESLERIQKIKL